MSNPDSRVSRQPDKSESDEERRKRIYKEFAQIYSEIFFKAVQDGPLKNKDGTDVGVNDPEQVRTVVLVSILIQSGRYDELKYRDKAYYYRLNQESRDRLIKATVDALNKARSPSAQVLPEPQRDLIHTGGAQPGGEPKGATGPNVRRRLEQSEIRNDYTKLNTLEQIVNALNIDPSHVSAEANVSNTQIAEAVIAVFKASYVKANRTRRIPNDWNLNATLMRMNVPPQHPLVGALSRAFRTQVIDKWTSEQQAKPIKAAEVNKTPISLSIERANNVVLESGQRNLAEMVRFNSPDGSGFVKIPLETLRAASTNADAVVRGPKVGTARDITSFQVMYDTQTGAEIALRVSGRDIQQNNANYILTISGEALTRILAILNRQNQPTKDDAVPIGQREQSLSPSPNTSQPTSSEAVKNQQHIVVAKVTERSTLGRFRKRVVLENESGQGMVIDKNKLKRAFELKEMYPASQDQLDFQIGIGRDINNNRIARIVGTDSAGKQFDARLGAQALADLLGLLTDRQDKNARQVSRAETTSQKDPIVIGKGEKDMKKNSREVLLSNGVRMVFGSDEGENYKDFNEDGVVVDPQTSRVTVLDGMGGMGKEGSGMVATEIISNALVKFRPNDARSLQNSLFYARDEIITANLDGGGSTLMSVQAEPKGNSYDIQYSFCGDSGLVMIGSNGNVVGYEGGHSIVGQQLANGVITEDEALYHPDRNLVSRSVDHQFGMGRNLIENKSATMPKGSRLVVGSDGLTDNLTPDEIATIVKGKTTNQAYQELVTIVKQRMRDRDKIYADSARGFGTDWQKARRSLGRFSDGYRSEPKRDNLTIVVMDLP